MPIYTLQLTKTIVVKAESPDAIDAITQAREADSLDANEAEWAQADPMCCILEIQEE